MSFTMDLHNLVSKYLPRRREQQPPDTDTAGIPFSNRDDIDTLRRDYEEKTRTAQDPTLESCFKCVACRISIPGVSAASDSSVLLVPSPCRPIHDLAKPRDWKLTEHPCIFVPSQLLLGIGPLEGQAGCCLGHAARQRLAVTGRRRRKRPQPKGTIVLASGWHVSSGRQPGRTADAQRSPRLLSGLSASGNVARACRKRGRQGWSRRPHGGSSDSRRGDHGGRHGRIWEQKAVAHRPSILHPPSLHPSLESEPGTEPHRIDTCRCRGRLAD